MATNGRKRFSSLVPRQSTSLISLNGTKSGNLTQMGDELSDKTPVTEIKLEPLLKTRRDSDNQVQNGVKEYKGILKCPSENIRARLSADLRRDREVKEEDNLEKTSSSSGSEDFKSRPNSSNKLERIEMSLQSTMRKIDDHKNHDDFNKCLGNYCLKAIDSVKNYSNVIETHIENLEYAREDTEKIVESVKDAESMELRLKKVHLLSFDQNNLTDDNLDFVSQILKEEADFQTKYKDTINVKKEPAVGANDKKKLLATLRAIDNGDSVDSFDLEKNQLMKELLGDTND